VLVGTESNLCLTMADTHRIAAHDSLVRVFTWSLGGFTETAAPGAYLVQGGVLEWGHGLRLPSSPVELLIS
jgi:hypothetical protein